MRLALLKKPLPGLRHHMAHKLGAAMDHSPYSHSNLVYTSGQTSSAWAGQPYSRSLPTSGQSPQRSASSLAAPGKALYRRR